MGVFDVNTIYFITYDPDREDIYWGDRCLVFEVPYDWAVEYCGSEDALAEFCDEYTTDDTMEMYCIAILGNEIISEKIQENIKGENYVED